MVSTLLAMQETWVQSLGWEDPLEKEMATRSPGESHGWRSLVGYSPWGYKESDMTVINALFLLLLHQLYLRSSSFRSQRLGTPAPIPISPLPNFCFPSLNPWREKPLNKTFSWKLHLMTIKNLMSHHHGVPMLRNMSFGFPSLDRKRNMFILPNESPHSKNRQNVFGSSHKEKSGWVAVSYSTYLCLSMKKKHV